jgi:DNA (cytosine-5)-methyltransferase 1
MKYISLFAGIGGFDLALNNLGHQCVWANDFDKYCKITYDKNFNERLDTTSITDVNTADIPDHDLLVGGFPCQSFSIAGKRRGFDDTRGTLFFDVARILADKRPRHFILENVKGLLSHDNGQTPNNTWDSHRLGV